ncbi:MAG: methyltransferase [Phycisphaerae bacterium]
MLEVGAGTGAVTRYLGGILGPRDTLDVCEIEPTFADILERDVLADRAFAPGVVSGRVRLLRRPVQAIGVVDHYDFVISGLPLTAFTLDTVAEILGVIRGCLRPGGVLSYFEYVGLRRVSRALSLGRHRARVRGVSAYLSDHIRRYEFDRQTVLTNLPPAYARHFRYAA